MYELRPCPRLLSFPTTILHLRLTCDTGTVEVIGDISVKAVDGHEFKTKKPTFSTSEHDHDASTKNACIENNTIFWALPNDENVRLPVHKRYASAMLFAIGLSGPGFLGAASDYIGMLLLGDVHDEETIVRIPVINNLKVKLLRQNYGQFSLSGWRNCCSHLAVDNPTATTHKHGAVGYMTCHVVVDSGPDEDHTDQRKARNEERYLIPATTTH
jgi:hypothetical protein